MVQTDVIALLPLLITAISSLIVLLLAGFSRNHLLAAGVTSLGLTAALVGISVRDLVQ